MRKRPCSRSCWPKASGRLLFWHCSSATTCPRRARTLGDGPRRPPGAVPQTSPLALTREINMRNPFSFAAFKCWGRVFADKSPLAQRAVYADPAFRNAFREELKNATGFSGDWRRITVHEAHRPELKRYDGRTVADVATQRGKDGLDTFLDSTLEDDLDIEFVLAQLNVNI